MVLALAKECVDKLQNLYFSNALIYEKKGEWEYLKAKLNDAIRLSEKYCYNEVLNDSTIENLSKNLLQSIKNDDLLNANRYLFDIINFLKNKSKKYVINASFKISRLAISISLIVSSLIIMLFSTINIYQWLVNLLILGASMASAALISYEVTQNFLLLITLFQSINIYFFNNAILFISQITITLVSIFNLILNKKIKANK